MRETLWLWLRGSAFLRKLYEFPLARRPMIRLSYLLVPSRRKRRLQVRRGPGIGLLFEISPRWEMHLWEGDYELAVQQVLVDQLMPGAVFYDVGGGFGFYSCLAARLGAQVITFEPDEENAKSLRHHAELNGFTPRIEIVRLAVLAVSGVTHFAPATQERGHGNGQVSEDRGQATTVNCTSLDEFVGRNPLPSLIKIDVEGSESEVLKGAEELFIRCQPSVICEVHDAANAFFVSDWLGRKGYSVEYIGNRSEYPVHLIAAAQ